MSNIPTHPSHTITIDRFTFEPKALPEADGRFHAQLTVDSGEGTSRTQRFSPSPPCSSRQTGPSPMPHNRPASG